MKLTLSRKELDFLISLCKQEIKALKRRKKEIEKELKIYEAALAYFEMLKGELNPSRKD